MCLVTPRRKIPETCSRMGGVRGNMSPYEKPPPAPTVGKRAIKKEFGEASIRAGTYRMREGWLCGEKLGSFDIAGPCWLSILNTAGHTCPFPNPVFQRENECLFKEK